MDGCYLNLYIKESSNRTLRYYTIEASAPYNVMEEDIIASQVQWGQIESSLVLTYASTKSLFALSALSSLSFTSLAAVISAFSARA